jgi:HD superfamily phosphodiesterase
MVEHLKAVARLAAQFAGKFGAADLGYWAGLWHDMICYIKCPPIQ